MAPDTLIWPVMMSRTSLITVLVTLALAAQVRADTVRVAVASNFGTTLDQLVTLFEQASSHEVLVSQGSTGKLYAQVVNGAPFDVLLAADRDRPERLERDSHAIAGTRFTYAIGRLVLWHPTATALPDGAALLSSDNWSRLAIANPDLAPYGLAARQALQRLSLWDVVTPKIVMGENIAQAWLFTASGNTDLGMVALAQVKARPDSGGATWVVPAAWHDPIEQQAVLLSDSPAARGFLAFMQSGPARTVIAKAGYDLPTKRD